MSELRVYVSKFVCLTHPQGIRVRTPQVPKAVVLHHRLACRLGYVKLAVQSAIVKLIQSQGWQTGLPSISFIGAQQVIALIAVCKSDYVYYGWHGALMTMAFVFFAISFNTVFIGKLPALEGIAVVLHVCGFFAVIVILWVMVGHNRTNYSPLG